MPSDSPIKVSVILPVYNVEKYIRECLESVVNQTLKEIEIICVDDGSTDTSAQILKEYADKDSRFVIFTQENAGAGPARNVGIQSARGEFIAFMDPDDWYPELDVLETLYTTAKAEGVNICGGSLEGHSPDGKITKDFGNGHAWGNTFSRNKRIQYKDYPYDWHYQRFLFSRKLLVDNNCLFPPFRRYQDPPFFVRAMVLSREFYALKKITYAYRSAPKTGIWEDSERVTHVFTAMRACIQLAKENNLELLLQRYLECLNRWNSWTRKALDSEKARNALMAAHAEFPEFHSKLAFSQCWDFFTNPQNNFPMEIVVPEIIKFWEADDIISSLSQKAWDCYPRFAKHLRFPPKNTSTKPTDTPKTIAFYYRCISNGGAQRVVADLCNLFAERKNDSGEFLFNVVCVTDDEYDGVQEEYPLHSRVKRANVPAFGKSQGVNYQKRFHAWRQIISDHAVDVVISGLWTVPCTFWDALCIKTHPRSPSFITHSHSYNMVLHLWSEESLQRVNALYGLSDGVVVLSDCDRRNAEKNNSHVYSIVNPIAFNPRETHTSSREKNAILWVGRISPEKHPEDAVRMMEAIVKQVPKAKLYLVGGGDKKLNEELKKLTKELGLSANIHFIGFTPKVNEFYQRASVFVSTTEYEGFPLSFGEAMAHGIPIVCYDMPWLTYIQDGRGIVSVERFNTDSLAQEIIGLLKKPSHAKTIGLEGREQIIEIGEVDLVARWKNLIDEIDGAPPQKKEFSLEECEKLDAINERFARIFRDVRTQKSQKKQLHPRFLIRKSSRNTPSSQKKQLLPRFLIRLASLFILSKSSRRQWRAKYMDLTPKDGVDVHALSPEERRLRKQKKRERNPLRRLFNAIVPATRSKISHSEKRLIRHMEWQTQQVLSAQKASQAQSERRFNELKRELAQVRERSETIANAQTAGAKLLQERTDKLSREIAVLKEAISEEILSAKHAAEESGSLVEESCKANESRFDALRQEFAREREKASKELTDSLENSERVLSNEVAAVLKRQQALETATIESYARLGKWRPSSLEFRTFGDLAHCIRTHLHKIPADVDLVVGLPRSGMIPAYTIALFMNKKCCSLDEFLSRMNISHGYRPVANATPRKILVVDDSCYSGRAMDLAREHLKEFSGTYEFVYAAVYGRTASLSKIDCCLEIVDGKRVWQWNYLNHSMAKTTCFDLDGVLCVDPTPEENDDGPKYLNFIKTAAPLYIPNYTIRAIITSRLEKYRSATEAWLREHGVCYDELVMLNLPTAEERRQKNCHASFKAEAYKARPDTTLFVESEERQAKEIAFLTGKEVLCVSTDELY